MQSITLLQGQWEQVLADEMCAVRNEVIIASPFVTRFGIDVLARDASRNGSISRQIHFLTNLAPLNQINGSTDPRALNSLFQIFDQTKVYHLPRLHAKTFVFDGERAVVTSGNLTLGGLRLNQEYGVLISDSTAAQEIRADLLEYARLGTQVSQNQLLTYCQIVDRAQEAYKLQTNSASAAARQDFVESVRMAQDELLELQLSQGPIHTVFERTALYFFRRDKELTTTQLHALIQSTHPELCDDSMDRVINGQHFGKRWKHAVRTVQQQLKAKGRIVNNNGLWRIVE